MRAKRWIALLVALGAGIAIAVYVLPAASTLKPLAIHVAPPRQLHVAQVLTGDNDPHGFDLSQLIPRGSRVNQVWYPSTQRNHQQILVEWTDPHRYVVWGALHNRTPRWGLRLWTETNSTRWYAVDLPVVEWAGPSVSKVDIRFADVTGDGRPDVLFEQDPGTNHGCGPHQIFATPARGVTTRVFSSYLCETSVSGDHGLLALRLAYYAGNDPACCASYSESLHLRWDGRRFVRASVRIDPAVGAVG